MNKEKTIFSQILDFVPAYEFRKYVEKYKGHYKVHKFTCWEQFICMAFAQLTYRESLREIEACFCANKQKLYHLGIRSKISRSTFADANERRNWRIYRDLALYFIECANTKMHSLMI